MSPLYCIMTSLYWIMTSLYWTMMAAIDILFVLTVLVYGELLYALYASNEDQEFRTVSACIVAFVSLCHIVLYLIAGFPCLLPSLAMRMYGALCTLLPDADASAELRRALHKIDELEAKNQELQDKSQVLQAKNQQLEVENLELEIDNEEQEAELEDARDIVNDYPLLALAARCYEHRVHFLQSDIYLLQNEIRLLEHENRQVKLARRESEDELRRANSQSEDLLRARIRTLESYTKVLEHDLRQAKRIVDMSRSVRVAERDAHIAERATLRVQAEEALMQLQANERQMAKHDEDVNAVVAERNALKFELLQRDHTISSLELEVANHAAHEQNLRQRNSDLRERNRDLRLRNGELQRQQETDAVTLLCANMVLIKRHEPPLSLPFGSTITTTQLAVAALTQPSTHVVSPSYRNVNPGSLRLNNARPNERLTSRGIHHIIALATHLGTLPPTSTATTSSTTSIPFWSAVGYLQAFKRNIKQFPSSLTTARTIPS